jgi:hypothetical protein
MMPTTTERVPQNTAEHVNEQIRIQTEANVARYAAAGPEAISRRLRELDHEWDVERLLETNASALAFIGVLLGAFVSPWFLLIAGLVTAFLFQHALQGWCPPIPILRRLGFRTQAEIGHEWYALKALRGDFRDISGGDGNGYVPDAHRAVEAARM